MSKNKINPNTKQNTRPTKKSKNDSYDDSYYESGEISSECEEPSIDLYELQTCLKLCDITQINEVNYTAKIADVLKTLIPPSLNIILDLNISYEEKVQLINTRLSLELHRTFTAQYHKILKQLTTKINYFKNAENITNNQQIEIAKNNIKINETPLLTRILLSEHSDDIKTLLYNKYLHNCEISGESVGKYENMINYALDLPTKSKPIENADTANILSNMYNYFNKNVYGMQNIKEEILGIFANMLNNDRSKNKIFGMVGASGVGKTMFARSLSQALDIPMQQLSLGGATNSAYLEGHNFTYSGSEPGMIARGLIDMKYNNGIFFIDEAEKTSKTAHGRELEHALLHIIDFTQNHDFRDKYMPEIPIDLSNCIFILSMNSTKGMDGALISRIPIIHLDGYNIADKVIMIDYLLPDICVNYGFKTGDITISKKTAQYLIKNVVEEGEIAGKSGVRNLKHSLDKIVKMINLQYMSRGKIELSYNIGEFSTPFEITQKLIDKFVLKPDNTYRNSMYA
jgi:ATP-dependent Lon protease